MKRTILSILAGVITAMASSANEYTFVFDGDGDVYGLTRQMTNKPDELKFVEKITFSEAGIDFSLSKTSETGYGFALVNAGGANAGLLVYSAFSSATAITPEFSLTVPNGKITAAKVYISAPSNAGLNALDLIFNNTEIQSTKVGSLYCWEWEDSEGSEQLTFGWENRMFERYVHSIEISYSPDLQGKEECGLSFAEKSAEAFIGEEFDGPQLSNPHDLTLSWTSSAPDVATVDENGGITLVSAGKTIISVSTPGDDSFAPGDARYQLTVIPSASDITEMKDFAPSLYDRVKVNFPMTVTYARGSYAFVIDGQGNATCIEDIRNKDSQSTTITTIYKVGDIIPAGWVATNAIIYESFVWEGLPDKVTETTEVTYPEVDAVTPEDVDRVVILKNVKFSNPTPYGNTKGYGTTPNGTSYEFQDTYGTQQQPAGTYDVTCVVKYSKRGSTVYFFLAPIAYAESQSAGIKDIETDAADTRYFNLQGLEVADPTSGIYIKVSSGTASKILIN